MENDFRRASVLWWLSLPWSRAARNTLAAEGHVLARRSILAMHARSVVSEIYGSPQGRSGLKGLHRLPMSISVFSDSNRRVTHVLKDAGLGAEKRSTRLSGYVARGLSGNLAGERCSLSCEIPHPSMAADALKESSVVQCCSPLLCQRRGFTGTSPKAPVGAMVLLLARGAHGRSDRGGPEKCKRPFALQVNFAQRVGAKFVETIGSLPLGLRLLDGWSGKRPPRGGRWDTNVFRGSAVDAQAWPLPSPAVRREPQRGGALTPGAAEERAKAAAREAAAEERTRLAEEAATCAESAAARIAETGAVVSHPHAAALAQ